MTASTAGSIASSSYAAAHGQLVTLISDIHRSGVDTIVELPRIVVIGSQSVGKSSLVEAITGIKVPRDANTCTRCPMEVKTERADSPWTCQISLRFEVDKAGKLVKDAAPIVFGPSLTDANAVEAMLCRAQLAILNPHVKDIDTFVSLSDSAVDGAKVGGVRFGNEKQLSFSTNVISLEIRGTDLTHLAFLDLPGLIAYSEKQDDDVDFVEKLVRNKIAGDSAIILLTVQMTDDFMNQKAVKLAKEADPEGKRTIGVFTKADRVQAGDHDQWILRLQDGTLKHPFFATKLVGTADLKKGLSFQDARAAEAAFFADTAPWNTVDAVTKSRYGTGRLVAHLSDELTKSIRQNLPLIRASIADKLAVVSADLAALPAAPSSDPAADLQARLLDLVRDLEKVRDAARGFGDFVAAKNRVDTEFKCAVEASRPVFVPFQAHERTTQQHAVAGWKSRVKTEADRRAQLAKEGQDAQGAPASAAAHAEASKTSSLIEPLTMNIDEIRVHINSFKGRRLPFSVADEAETELMARAMLSWRDVAFETLEAMREPVKQATYKALDMHFGRGANEDLRLVVRNATADTLDALFATASSHLTYLLTLDDHPATLNVELFALERRTALELLRSARNGLDLAAVQADGKGRFDVEFTTMAQVTAYWEVACKRFIDLVPRALDTSIARALPAAVRSALVRALFASSAGRDLAALTREDAHLAEEREALGVVRKRLEEAKGRLERFEAGVRR
ncbi:hypothetical protein JCM10450v2_006858 [Rhodotorula kratochvilovae]